MYLYIHTLKYPDRYVLTARHLYLRDVPFNHHEVINFVFSHSFIYLLIHALIHSGYRQPSNEDVLTFMPRQFGANLPHVSVFVGESGGEATHHHTRGVTTYF